ncbi:uncharacterized protein VTP21DRAFT_8447 [Calcarisporiella thermophila]|uniref:uncharacterized protein n=1 Tax=Calcarisporiella thermophila TaxID=911321 RepID=UPI003742E80F
MGTRLISAAEIQGAPEYKQSPNRRFGTAYITLPPFPIDDKVQHRKATIRENAPLRKQASRGVILFCKSLTDSGESAKFSGLRQIQASNVLYLVTIYP